MLRRRRMERREDELVKFIDFFDRAVAGVSNSQLYKQAGNAVTVNVAEVIGRRLKEIEVNECLSILAVCLQFKSDQ